MTPADALTKIEAELQAATPGPWKVTEYLATIFRKLTGPDLSTVGSVFGAPNAALIAHAPTYLAALVEVAKAAQRFRHYGDLINNWLADGPTERRDDWIHELHKARADTDAALDALTKAVNE